MPVFEKVLVPVDFSPGSDAAIGAVQEIPGVREIVLLHVVYNRFPAADPAVVHPRIEEARAALEEVRRGLAKPGVAITAIAEEITGGEIEEVVSRTAARLGIPLVVMGRRGAGIIESLLLGSVASDLVRYGRTDLLLLPPAGAGIPRPSLFSHVMICTDFSLPEIGEICSEGIPWIRRVSLFHAVSSGDSEEEIRSQVKNAETRLGAIRETFTRQGTPASVHVRVGSAPEEILAFSRKEDVSLVLLKATGKRSLSSVFIGSTSAPVARNADIPVLILRRSLP
jgi:nucleotide-binding universal stress UspA family protein